jgi:hypothetical protein
MKLAGFGLRHRRTTRQKLNFPLNAPLVGRLEFNSRGVIKVEPMARIGTGYLSEHGETGWIRQFDTLRLSLLAVHLVLVGYVACGWLIPSRSALNFYTLLLPMIAMQWLLNDGCSTVNNVENLVRVGRWNDSDNEFEGAFFKTLFCAAGVPASQAQITTSLCSLMLTFWVCAICRMILIVPSA